MSSGSVLTGNVWTLSLHLYGKAWFNHRVKLLHDGFTVADLLAVLRFAGNGNGRTGWLALHARESGSSMERGACTDLT